MPWKGFNLVDTVTNDSPLWFGVVEGGIWKRAPPHAFVNLSCQRGTTIGVELQGLASITLVGIIVQLGVTLVKGCASGVKVVIRLADGPS